MRRRKHDPQHYLIVICELGVALVCSVIYNSLRLYVDKRLLEQSLAVHLSPALVKRVTPTAGHRHAFIG